MAQLIIEADRAERQYWRDLWQYRELFYFLAWRDLLVRYKQTVVGVTWAFIRPILTMLILTFVFGKLGKMPSGGIPYPLLVLCGMLPWQFFSTAMSESGGSLVQNSSLVSKVYFPRMVIVASSVITSLTDFAISLVFFALLMIWYKSLPPLQVLLMPVMALMAIAISLGVGMWIAALTVRYRDFRIIVPFVVQFGLYLSPVGFSSSVVPARFQLLYSMNPMVGIIEGFRWCLLGTSTARLRESVSIAAIEVVVLLATGIWYFRKTERTFADVI